MNKLMQTVTENVAYVVIFLAVSVGDIVDVQVLTVDVAKKRIGLTMKIQKQ